MQVHLLERPMPLQSKPSIAWPSDEVRQRIDMERTLEATSNRRPVDPDIDPDKLVRLTVKLPPALHELLCMLTWEFHASISDVVRGILWDRLLGLDFLEVPVDENEPTVPYGETH